MLLAVRLAIFHAMMLDGIHKISLCFIEHHRSDKQNQQDDPQPDHQVRYGNNGTGIHPQLNPKSDQHLKIAVFCRQGCQDHSGANCEQCQHHKQDRCHQTQPGDSYLTASKAAKQQDQKQQELCTECDQFRDSG